jgi:hypothetical protein
MPGKARRTRTSPPPNYSMKLTSSLRSDCATIRPTAALLRLRRNAPWGCSLSRAHYAARRTNRETEGDCMQRNLALASLGVVLLGACATPAPNRPATDLQQPLTISVFRPPT